MLHTKQLLSKNLTTTAVISTNGIEFLQFTYGGGTLNETFLEYFQALINSMKIKYPDKKLVFILDNLW